jgi:hypothetical protein
MYWTIVEFALGNNKVLDVNDDMLGDAVDYLKKRPFLTAGVYDEYGKCYYAQFASR